MLETNLRIVAGGGALRVPVRYAAVETAHVTGKMLETACNVIRDRHRVAGKPVPGRTNEIVVLSSERLRPVKLEDENLTLTITDCERTGCELSLGTSEGISLLPALFERALLGQVARTTNLWRLDSPRKWLERDPFVSRDEIDAYRRIEISSLFVEDVGVSIAVDISTAFLTARTLDHFFALGASVGERRERQTLFNRLTSRQKGQKGTLVYRVGGMTRVCYFEKLDSDRPCGKTPEFKINGRRYGSVHEYYAEKYPDAKISPDDPAALVSFRGMDSPVWVAARLLSIRVMNDSLPESLTSVDKIAPPDRVRMIDEFWSRVGCDPFGNGSLGLCDGFWQPEGDRTMLVPVPALEFGKGQILEAPSNATTSEYKKHYRKRAEMLESAGAYHVPPAADRTLHCAHPRAVSAEIAAQFAGDIARALNKWTGVPFKINLCGYSSLTDATARLRTASAAGTVLFILDEKPASYHECAFQLSGWRVKRATISSVLKHHRYLQDGAWDRKKQEMNQRRGWQKWEQYILMNALDVLQQMDGVPFRVPSIGQFEGQLAIDVGRDRRYIAISLIVARDKNATPNFRIVTDVQPKTDPKLDTINPTILSDSILQLFGRTFRGKFEPLTSLLGIRDGELRGEELTGLSQAYLRLKEKGFLTADAATSIAELHKSTLKNIRLWERTANGSVSNPLEGSVVILSSCSSVITTTGEATLHQGTAEPMMVVCAGPVEPLRRVSEAVAVGAQLNWGSPGVAQRLPIAFKRTDEELEIRSTQEIRRIA